MTDEQEAFSRLIWLQQSGGLSQGTGNQIVQEVAAERAKTAARERMTDRCLDLSQIHGRLAWAYKLRANATTPEMQEAADKSIGRLQAELKNVEAGTGE